MSKRKRVVLNFQQKLDILQQLNEGKSGANLAKEYGIGSSTITDIKRNGDAILQFVSKLESENQLSEKKTRKTAQNTDLDSRVYKWYLEEKTKGVLPLNSEVSAKALEINGQLTSGSQHFKASPGWLRHFKKRHRIKDLKEPLEQPLTATRIVKQFKSFMKRGGYTLENVYNVDDAVLLWKSLPNCHTKSVTAITLIACTNANASHKLPLCIIGSEKKCELYWNQSVNYKYQQGGGMNLQLFEDWFADIFIPQVKQRQQERGNVGKVLLTMDNASWHPHRDVLIKNRDKIDVFYVPYAYTSSIQPMDLQMQRLKMIYRKKLIEFLHSKSPCPIKQFLEEFTLKESIPVISEAWDSIPRTHIVQSWGRLLLSDVTDGIKSNQDEVLEIVAIAQKIVGLELCNVGDVTQWLECDKDDYCYGSLDTEDDIGLSSCEENQGDATSEGPSDIEAYQCFNTVIQWFTRQNECNSAQLATLESLRDLVATKICGKIKQEPD